MSTTHVEIIDKAGKTVGRQTPEKVLRWYQKTEVPHSYSIRTSEGVYPVSEWVANYQSPPALPESLATQPVPEKQKQPWGYLVGAVVLFIAMGAACAVAVLEVHSLRRQLLAIEQTASKSHKASTDELRDVRQKLEAFRESQRKITDAQLKVTKEIDYAIRNKIQSFMKDAVVAVETNTELATTVGKQVIDIRDRVLALERRFGLAPDPNPHPKEAFKDSGLPGPKLETEKSPKKDETD
jgi:hypothetical protein